MADRAQRGEAPGSVVTREAARPRCHARGVPRRLPDRRGPRSRTEDGGRERRSRPDRRRRRSPLRRAHRARARPPVHPRVPRGLTARRADGAAGDRRRPPGHAPDGGGSSDPGAGLGAGDGQRLAEQRRSRRRGRRRRPAGFAGAGDPRGDRVARHEQRHGSRSADPRARPRPRDLGGRLVSGQLRDEPDDHALGAVPRADRGRPAHRRRRRPRLGHRRSDQGRPLPGGRRRRLGRSTGWPGDPRAPRPSGPAAGPARRSCRAGPKRPGGRGGGDRRDPRPSPHRLDRDERSIRSDRPRRW